MAFVSCREIAVHCPRLRRQLRAAWMPDALCIVSSLRLAGSDTRVNRHKKLDDLLSPRSLQFFNSPNIHSCKWMPPIHLIKSLWFCPLEIEFAISSPELSPCTVTRLRKTEFISSAVHDGLTCVKSKLFLCEVVMVLQNYWKRNWTNDCWLFVFKFAKSTLLPNSSKITFNHANVFCLLFVLKHRLLCNHVHCIYCMRQAYGTRVQWPTRIITNDLGFLPHSMPLR